MQDNSDSCAGQIGINLTSLERDWASQPELAEKWYSRLAEANFEVDELKVEVEVVKEDLEQTDARLNLQIRQAPNTKQTEKAIDSAVLLHADHKAAKQAYFDAKRKLNKAVRAAALTEAKTHAIDHKKKGLEKCVELLIGHFYSLPKESVKYAADERNKREEFRLGRPRPRD